jgi:aspartate aminotransferase
MKISKMAETLIGSEIIKLAGEINERVAQGQKIYNFTIGDFEPSIFPIPQELTQGINSAYLAGETNYPAANGIAPLRRAVSDFLRHYQGIEYSADEILIAGGARPLIYAAYQTILDAGDTVVFPVPSWNNNHYCHLTGAIPVYLQTQPDTFFMPTADDLRPHVQTATLIALCSPLNPTGTVFSRAALLDICQLVWKENQRRAALPDTKPLYIMYDQIYWVLTYGDVRHEDPISLMPELRPYVVYIDGLSKAFAATGVRVGWAFGSTHIIKRMQSILSHIGAWSPKAEQVATAQYLNNRPAIDKYLQNFRAAVAARLTAIYDGFMSLRADGYAVDAIAPQAAIYLTIRFDLIGKKTPSGAILATTADITAYLLNEASLAIVPFYAFGADKNSTWYRLSVGTSALAEIPEMLARLRSSLAALS